MKRLSQFNLAILLLLALAACSSEQPKPKAAEAPAEPPLPAKATAIIQTDVGKLTCELFPGEAPRNVANFIGLAEGTKEWEHPLNHRMFRMKLYDGTSFHRVIPGFMIQGGDPAGNGAGGPGYHVLDEISPKLKFDRTGRMAMAAILTARNFSSPKLRRHFSTASSPSLGNATKRVLQS